MDLLNFFKKRNHTDLKNFILALKNGEHDFFKLLSLDESEFIDASFEQIMLNESDVLSGVSDVKIHQSSIFFKLFDGCLIKYHDNGDVKLVLYTITKDYEKILQMSYVFSDELGTGYWDNEHTDYFNKNNVTNLASANNYSGKDIVHIWLYNNLSFLLQYKVAPLREFSLMITIGKEKVIDRAVKRSGTILDLLDFEINTLLVSNSCKRTLEYKDDYVISEFDVQSTSDLGLGFTNLKVTMFGDVCQFDKNTKTNIRLYAKNRFSTHDKIKVVDKLISVYGSDDHSSLDLEYHEIEKLDSNIFWVGRQWSLNQSHALWNIDNKSERLGYILSIYDHEDDYGFSLEIIAYDELIGLFGIEE